MVFSVFVLSLIILLCLIIVKGTLLQFSIFIVIKEKINFLYTIIPSILSLLTHFILISCITIILYKFNISVGAIIYNNIFNIDYPFRNLLYLFTAYLFGEFIYLFLQAFILKLTSFDWVFKVNSISNMWQKEKPQALQVYNACDNLLNINNKLTYFNRFLSCLICSAFSFFAFSLLFYLGRILGTVILSNISF